MPKLTDFDYNCIIEIMPKYWVECLEKLMIIDNSKVLFDVSDKYLIVSNQDEDGYCNFMMNLSKPKTLCIKRPQINSSQIRNEIDNDIDNCINILSNISIKNSNNNPYNVLECKEHMYQCVYKLDYLHEFSKKISNMIDNKVLLKFSVNLPFKIECMINELTGTSISFYLAPY